MALDIVRLLELSAQRVFDVDDEGKVLTGTDESGSVQLAEIHPDGTSTALTALSGAVTGRYLPGARAVIVQHDTDGDERGQLALLRPDALRRPAALDDLEPLVRDPAHVHRLVDVAADRITYITNRRNGVDFDVVVRRVSTGAEQVVYDRGGMVMAVCVSPDGERVALTVPGDRPMSDQLLVVDSDSGAEKQLTRASEDARHLQPHWLPDGSALIVTSNSGRDRTAVLRLDPRTGDRRWLVTSDEHELTGWLAPDGRTLLVHANDDGTSRLALHDAGSGELRERVLLPSDGWCSFPLPTPVWSPNSRHVALSFSAPDAPGDALLLDPISGAASALTDSSAHLRGESLITPTTHRVRTADGEQVPCFVYSPTEPDPRIAGSAVLILHGGPESQSVRTFSPIVQALAAQGHAVLVPNVRGSTGYGKRWYSADDRRARLDAVADLGAIHDWLAELGLDRERAALWGGSYGGYMVLAGLAFQPRRWAAGVDIVGISSLVTFLENTAPYRRAHREREYGSLESDADFLREASPLNSADHIAAPLFVIHGANDPRVPLSEAEQLAKAVRSGGVDCALTVYRDEGHGLAKRVNRLHAYPRALRFLARHLGTGR